jgi:hypothetical protein
MIHFGINWTQHHFGINLTQVLSMAQFEYQDRFDIIVIAAIQGSQSRRDLATQYDPL